MGGVNGAIRACMNHEGLVTAPPPPPGVSQALRPLECEVRAALEREPGDDGFSLVTDSRTWSDNDDPRKKTKLSSQRIEDANKYSDNRIMCQSDIVTYRLL